MTDPDRELALQLVNERAMPFIAHLILLAILLLLLRDAAPVAHVHAHLGSWVAAILLVWFWRLMLWGFDARRPPRPPSGGSPASRWLRWLCPDCAARDWGTG